MISLRNVSLVYPNGVHALDNVNLEIAKGEFIFLTGASGAGKSTLLNRLCGARKIGHAQDPLVLKFADKSENFAVGGVGNIIAGLTAFAASLRLVGGLRGFGWL